MGELLAILSLLMFSINVIVTKVASSRLDLNIGFLISITVNALFSGLLFAGEFLIRNHPFEFHWFGFFMFFLSGIFASYLGRILYFDTIAKLGPSKASAFMVSNPLFTVLISWIILGELLSPLEFIAVFVVLFGLFLVSYIPQKKIGSAQLVSSEQELAAAAANSIGGRRNWRQALQPGTFFALLSSLSYALGNIARGTGVANWNEPILGGFIGAFTGVLLQLLLNSEARNMPSKIKSADRKAIGLYIFSGVLTISAQIGQIASMRYIPISIATLITMSQSLFVIPLSYFLLKNEEGINSRVIMGSLLVLMGIGTILLY